MKHLHLTDTELALLIVIASQADPGEWTTDATKALIYRCKDVVRMTVRDGKAVHVLRARITLDD